jgi:hypothetical protein
MRRTWAGIAFACTLALTAQAHNPSDSYLRVDVVQQVIALEWAIALRDLDAVQALDSDGDGAVMWGELRRNAAAISAYALTALEVSLDGAPCAYTPARLLIDDLSDGAYAVIRARAHCPRIGARLALDYRLFALLDPQHRGLVSVHAAGAVQSVVLGAHYPRHEFALAQLGMWHTFKRYAIEGVLHISGGFDHLLFVLSLLLPAIACPRRDGWRVADGWATVALDVGCIVSAFTLAHSLTLSAAVLGWLELPRRPLEAAIALSLVVAALANLAGVAAHQRMWIAFGFGLLHGCGFAGALAELGLPGNRLALALFGFNLGVECGQLAFVLACLPVTYLLRESAFYRIAVYRGGSLSIALIGAWWFCERCGFTL